MELALDHGAAEFAEILAVVIAVGVDDRQTAGRALKFRQLVEDGGEIAGCIAALIEGTDTAEIAGIATADTEQNRGKD
jgi:N-acetylglutamate synthase-like GNAT family acetyltransferase